MEYSKVRMLPPSGGFCNAVRASFGPDGKGETGGGRAPLRGDQRAMAFPSSLRAELFPLSAPLSLPRAELIALSLSAK